MSNIGCPEALYYSQSILIAGLDDSSEEVIGGPVGPDPDRLFSWQPKDHRSKEMVRKIWEVEQWIERQHQMVEEEAVIMYVMKRYDVNRQSAQRFLKRIVEDFENHGVPVLHR